MVADQMTSTLILIPTIGERQILAPRFAPLLERDISVQLCGFGPVAAGAKTSQLIGSLQPKQIILVGIAGALADDLAVGQAEVFEHVAMYGIGAGTGDTFRNAGQLGWLHWTECLSEGTPVGIGDAISLQRTDEPSKDHRQLLTVCAAAGCKRDARDRKAIFPNAVAEDMEGYAVAMAGAFAGVPVSIVRGISNLAGDREKIRWRIPEALHAAADLVLKGLS